MRKEIIIRMRVKSDKYQAKAMKVAAAVSGVESVTLAGGDKSLLLVIGDGVDPNKLSKKLKEKAGGADIVELRTVDTLEAAFGAGGSNKEMAAAARYYSSPYHHQYHHQYQYGYYAPLSPASPYAYHYYPTPVGGGYNGYGPAGGISSYSLAAARSHPAHYSPLVERHDYQPMEKKDKDKSSAAAASVGSKKSESKRTMAVPRRGGDTMQCCVIM